jgi:peptidoglycan/xylan/chitin deacetylase (PgdA/CDA1 family)
MYHRFGVDRDERKLDVKVLEEQLRYLRRHFNVVRLRELATRLRSGARPHPYTVALTVDDAYADFGELAYPVFRRYGIPVTVYVVSEFASGRMWLWWDAIRYVLGQAGNREYQLAGPDGPIKISLSDKASRERAWLTLAGIGVTLSPEERDRHIQELREGLAVSLPNPPVKEFAAMDWGALRALDPEIVEIGAHTCTHPILSRCDSGRIVQEVVGSKKAIEGQLGREVKAFCYPNGEWADVDERCIAAVREAGFDNAVMACGTMVCKGASLYALERIPASHIRNEFESDISGVSHMRRHIADRGGPTAS